MTAPKRVLLADDHPAVRFGLRSLLETTSEYIVCGEAPDGRQALALAATLRPDVIIMDIFMPKVDGIEATRELRRTHPAVMVLIYSTLDSERTLTEVYAAGACGYVCKRSDLDELTSALQSLNRAHFFVSAPHLERNGITPAELRERLIRGNGDPLTAREREVVKVLADGRSNKEAACDLGISVKTAETHRARIMRKLRLRSFAELVQYAIRNRYLSIEGD